RRTASAGGAVARPSRPAYLRRALGGRRLGKERRRGVEGPLVQRVRQDAEHHDGDRGHAEREREQAASTAFSARITASHAYPASSTGRMTRNFATKPTVGGIPVSEIRNTANTRAPSP